MSPHRPIHRAFTPSRAYGHALVLGLVRWVVAYSAPVLESGSLPERAAFVPLRALDGFLVSRQYLQYFLLMP